MDVLSKIGEVVIPGLLIVFAALIILIGAVWLMGRIMATNKKKDKPAPPAANASPAPASAANKPNAAPAAANGIPEETVAVISAAVAGYMDQVAPGVPYAIRSIGRPRESRPVWGFAGMQQNTRPF